MIFCGKRGNNYLVNLAFYTTWASLQHKEQLQLIGATCKCSEGREWAFIQQGWVPVASLGSPSLERERQLYSMKSSAATSRRVCQGLPFVISWPSATILSSSVTNTLPALVAVILGWSALQQLLLISGMSWKKGLTLPWASWQVPINWVSDLAMSYTGSHSQQLQHALSSATGLFFPGQGFPSLPQGTGTAAASRGGSSCYRAPRLFFFKLWQ